MCTSRDLCRAGSGGHSGRPRYRGTEGIEETVENGWAGSWLHLLGLEVGFNGTRAADTGATNIGIGVAVTGAAVTGAADREATVTGDWIMTVH